METILKLDNIKKSYGKKEILKGISMDIREGEIISVLGPSGCGKSTLLNIIAGIIGLVDETDLAAGPHMRAKDNILYGLKVKKAGKQEMQKKLEEVVALLHLEGLLEHYPSELSGGQQQRVAIARA